MVACMQCVAFNILITIWILNHLFGILGLMMTSMILAQQHLMI